MKLWDRILNFFGWAIGEAEMVGLVYPVKPYVACVEPGVLFRGSRPDSLSTPMPEINLVVSFTAERQIDDNLYRIFPNAAFINIPILDNTCPTDTDVKLFLAYIENRVEGLSGHPPIFCHCEAGIGRTGCMIAAYRVKINHWTPKRALEEAKSYGLKMPCQIEWIKNLKE